MPSAATGRPLLVKQMRVFIAGRLLGRDVVLDSQVLGHRRALTYLGPDLTFVL